MKWIVGLLLVVVVAGLFGDSMARSAAEARAAEHVQTSLRLEDEPSVEIEGWPFLLHALRGSFPSITIDAPSFRARGVELEQVVVTLEEVEVSAGQLLAGAPDGVRSGGGRGEAVLTGEALAHIVQRSRAPASVTLEGDRVLVEAHGTEAEGRVKVKGSNLVIRAEGLPQAIRVGLPKVIEGLSYEDVTIEDSRAHLTFTLSAARLSAP